MANATYISRLQLPLSQLDPVLRASALAGDASDTELAREEVLTPERIIDMQDSIEILADAVDTDELTHVAADYSATYADSLIIVDALTGPRAITLPVGEEYHGRKFTVKSGSDFVTAFDVSVSVEGGGKLDTFPGASAVLAWREGRVFIYDAIKETYWIIGIF